MSVERKVVPTPGLFPEGTAVGCYLLGESDVERREGRHPFPAPAATGVISEGAVEFTGLTANTDYVLEAFVDEIQKVKVDATGGKHKLKLSGQTTSDLKYNATSTEVKEALVALSNVAEGDVEVSGGPGNSGGTTPYIITFRKAWAAQNVPTLEHVAGSEALSGGGAAATISTVTEGSESGAGGIQRTCLFTTGE
jgi:hypothetical protein